MIDRRLLMSLVPAAAMLFVAAPLYLSAAREAFAQVDPRYEMVARTLGDSPSLPSLP